jgi:putative acetyltransferase
LPTALVTIHNGRVLIRRETPADSDAIRAVTTAAFARPDQPGQAPPEAGLIDELRSSQAWLPPLSLVATQPDGEVIGQVLCTRGHVGVAAVLALGPIGVQPGHQGRSVGSALMHAVLGAADALGEPLVALLGNPSYYQRFGFRLSTEYDITPPVPAWRPHLQVRVLTEYTSLRGTFAYPAPFDSL